MTNHDAYPGIQRWAMEAGFPADNILDNGAVHQPPGTPESMSPLPDPVADLAAAVRRYNLDDAGLVVLEADVVPEPGLSLQRIVEHAVVRGKDVVTAVVPPPGEDLSAHSRVAFAEGGDAGDAAVNPRVASIDAAARGAADGVTRAVLGPVAVLRRASIPDVLAAAKFPKAVERQLGALLAHVAATRPVYALHLDTRLGTATAGAVAIANGFLSHHARNPPATTTATADAAATTTRGPAAEALAQVIAANAANGGPQMTGPRGEPLPESYYPALTAASGFPVRQSYLTYLALTEMQAAAAAKLSDGARAAAANADSELQSGFNGLSGGTLPLRFRDVTTRRHAPRPQHPVYTTTNNDYGLKPVRQLDVPGVYAGSTGLFTKTFAGPVRDGSLITSISRSKVHTSLDEF